MSKTTNKFSPEVRQRAIRMVLDHEAEHPSRWAAVSSIAAKIGCSPATLHEWVKKTEVDSGKRARPRSSIGVDHGGASRQWNSTLLNGSTGSTTDDFSNRLEYTASRSREAILRHAGRSSHGRIT